MKYIVHSLGGFGHSFICQLIFNILTNGKYPIDLQPEIGSAHPVSYDSLCNDEVSVVSASYPIVKSTEPDILRFAITITEDDISMAKLNHFYKNIMYNGFRGTCDVYWNNYDKLVNTNILPKRNIKSFKELPSHEAELLIKSVISKSTLTHLMPRTLDVAFIELKFKDVFNDMYTTISIIENAVGIKATQKAIEWYEEYLEAQVILKDRHFPWLPK